VIVIVVTPHPRDRSYSADDHSYINEVYHVFYFAFVTFSTIGFGDFVIRHEANAIHSARMTCALHAPR
jgi:hypothetical protein